jgi:hypothetical protein
VFGPISEKDGFSRTKFAPKIGFKRVHTFSVYFVEQKTKFFFQWPVAVGKIFWRKKNNMTSLISLLITVSCLCSLYKPPNTDDITPDLAGGPGAPDLLEIGKIERDIVEKETLDKDRKEGTGMKELEADIMKEGVVGSVKHGCDITGAFPPAESSNR